jgi:hypothetical protein
MRTAAATTLAPCPDNGQVGPAVPTITLKALLRPDALVRLHAGAAYRYCGDPACPTVYYTDGPLRFAQDDLKVPVFAKEAGADVPVCYCFGWTRARLHAAGNAATAAIRGHVQAGRCGCEVNNPKGSCCLGDVVRALHSEPSAANSGDDADCCAVT